MGFGHLEEIKKFVYVIDMHTHTFVSGDSKTTVEDYMDQLNKTPLTHVCVTDHNSIEAALYLREKLGDKIIIGQEQKSVGGEIIGLFLNKKLPALLDSFKLCEEIKSQGGITYIPHPFEKRRLSVSKETLIRLIKARLVDLVEVKNAKSRTDANASLARKICQKYGIAMGAGSDSHVKEALGACVVATNVEPKKESFCLAISQGQIFGQFFDPPLTFSPKIVPSKITSS